MNDTVIILLLIGLVASAITCMVIQNLLKASIALAAVSAILSAIMFIMGANLAAVFELSVCAGLVTVVFISAISMTPLRSKEELAEVTKGRHKRFMWLPVVLIITAAVTLFVLLPHLTAIIPGGIPPVDAQTPQDIFWTARQQDMLGQIIIVLAGVFGVLIFFKEREKE